MKTYKTLILDIDRDCINEITKIIKSNTPYLKVTGIAHTIEYAKDLIKSIHPDLIITDIVLEDGLVFELFKSFSEFTFQIIFLSSLNELALDSFSYSPLNFISKPLHQDLLIKTIEKFRDIKNNLRINESIQILKNGAFNDNKRILLPTTKSLDVYHISEIIRFEAATNYTIVYFINGTSTTISRPLYNIEKTMIDFDFVRIHSKFLINLRYVMKYTNGKKPSVVLIDNTEFSISSTFKDNFINKLNFFAKSL
jgi:two-component system LytT family response regulator